jgi:starch phosphorylase
LLNRQLDLEVVGEADDDEQQKKDDAQSLYETLEEEVIRLYYDRDDQALPRRWIRRQKRAIRSLGRKISTQRMVVDYTQNCYLPAAGGVLCEFPEGTPAPR